MPTRLLSPASLPALLIALACANPQKQVESLTARARAHLNDGRVNEAMPLLDSVIALVPTSANAYKNRGNARRMAGDLDGAIVDYSRAISLDSTDSRFFSDRGLAYLLQRKFEPALQDYDSALALNPNHTLASNGRGRINFYMGNFKQAEADLARGLAGDSTNIYDAIWLYFIRARLGNADTAAFRAQFVHMDTVTWPAPVARFYLGQTSVDEFHKQSTGVDPTTGVDLECARHFFLGEHELMNADSTTATSEFEQAEAICPKQFTEYYGAVAELERLRK